MIEFRNLTKKRVPNGVIKKLYNKIFRKSFELSVVFAPPVLMKKLNVKYRHRNKAANVLSFLIEKNRGEIFLNAGEKKIPYLFLHGALHLKGYDHVKDKDADKMEKLEKKLLNNR